MANTPLHNESGTYWSQRVEVALCGDANGMVAFDRCRLLGRGVINGYVGTITGDARSAFRAVVHSYMAVFPGVEDDTDWLEYGSFHAEYGYDKKRLGLLALQGQPNVSSQMYGGPDNHVPAEATRDALLRTRLPLAVILFYGTHTSRHGDEFGGLAFPASLGPWQTLRAIEGSVIEQMRGLANAEALDFDEV